MTTCSTADQTTQALAYRTGFAEASRGQEARPGCPTSARGKAYMRGYIAGAASDQER